ncbi:mariner Mos1 transposase [Trichonephila clavipes]|nr:mariner Mos1 transposase [Trichonephila clavipes]
MDRNSICEALAKQNKIDSFLKRMVTGHEKWVTYDNIVRKRSWSKCGEAAQTVAKPGLTAMKILLYLYCQQLNRLKLAINQKRPGCANRTGVVFHQDNAKLYTSAVTRQKLGELRWKVLMHPSCSPDLASSDYHLVLALKNFPSDKFGSREVCENRLLEFFANKDQVFYERDIMRLYL